MKPEELMIGDWVHCPKLVDKEEGDDGNCQIKQLYVADLDVYSFKELKYDEIEPIQITSEILEKNGFTKSVSPPGIHARCYELDNKKDRYNLTIADYNKYNRLLLDVDSEDSECFNIKCDYVHELQHALRLCKINKKIEL
jgi:hypothetical protein